MSWKTNRQYGSRLWLEPLEDRVLYSADALGGFDTVASSDKQDSVFLERVLNTPSSILQEISSQQQRAENHESFPTYEIAFVDTDTIHYQQLLDDLLQSRSAERNIEVFLLDNTKDGIQQIGETLASYDSLDAVHIISHGTDGAIDLGASQLDSTTLISHRADLIAWGNAFEDTGDLLIYGCDIASTATGQNFVDTLATLTATDVAASVDLTGQALLGGDWDLEYQRGNIETDVAVSIALQQRWAGILATSFTPIGTETLVNVNTAG